MGGVMWPAARSKPGAKFTPQRKGEKMKVTINKDAKKVITLAQLDGAKMIIDQMKEDESTAAEYAEYAVNAILSACGDYCETIFTAAATVYPNRRVYEQFGEGSDNLDIWIEGCAKGSRHFVEYGAYLSDIWSLTGDNSESIAACHMFSVLYSRN